MPARPCARHSRAGRRQPGARSICRSTSRDLDCDFYCFTGHKLYGPTGIGVLYGKRERLQPHAALHGRRRDDPRRHRGHGHLRRPAAPLRGRHAADRPGDRPRRGDRLCRGDRPRADRRPRGGARATTRRSACRRHQQPHASTARRRTRARSSPSTSPAPTRTTSRRSSTAKASRCAPAPIAPSRFSPDMA